MTDEEIRQIFKTRRDDVPQYDLVAFDLPDDFQYGPGNRSKRSYDDSEKKKILLNSFEFDLDLYLEPYDHVVFGDETPYYLASYHNGKVIYNKGLFVRFLRTRISDY